MTAMRAVALQLSDRPMQRGVIDTHGDAGRTSCLPFNEHQAASLDHLLAAHGVRLDQLLEVRFGDGFDFSAHALCNLNCAEVAADFGMRLEAA